MTPIPSNGRFDSTLALLRDPYRFISRTCHHLLSDIFRTRLLLAPAICVTGREAARLFYGEGCLDRQPRDGDADGSPTVLDAQRVKELAQVARQALLRRAETWGARPAVALHGEVQEVLMEAACAWAGIPLPPGELALRTGQVAALDAASGLNPVGLGPRRRARAARRALDAWLEGVVRDAREQDNGRPTPLRAIAHLHGADGAPLPEAQAAAMLLAILRPVVAAAAYLVLEAHALHAHPAVRYHLGEGGRYTAWFVQEVRRFYPFQPAAIGVARDDLDWQGHRVARGTRVLLDLYGTDHDHRLWREPDTFAPERFADWRPDPFAFIPQGAGPASATDRRSADEAVTVALMTEAAELFTSRIAFTVPPQDLELDFAHTPALPRSRFVVSAVRVA